jgi:hypothetical protein
MVPRSSGKPSRADRFSIRLVEREPVAELVGDDVREERRRRERAGEALRRHRRGLDQRVAVHVDHPVLRPCVDEHPGAAPLPGDLAALLEVEPLGLPLGHELLEDRIEGLDPHDRELQVAQIAPAGGLALLGGGAVATAGGRRRTTVSMKP